MRFKYTILLVLVVIFVLIGLIDFIQENQECENKGGVYVKSAFGYECVEEDR